MHLNNLSKELEKPWRLRILLQNTTRRALINVSQQLNNQQKTLEISNTDGLHGSQSETAYFLPWKENAGLSVILPKDSPQTNVFFTAKLTGCLIGVSETTNEVKIGHYNYMDIDGPKEFDFSQYRKWLIPNNRHLQNIPQGLSYQIYDSDCVFWGEYNNGNWKFYYQCIDGKINTFGLQ